MKNVPFHLVSNNNTNITAKNLTYYKIPILQNYYRSFNQQYVSYFVNNTVRLNAEENMILLRSG